MDRKGHWKVNIKQYMWDDYSEVNWQLFDPNGFEAGKHNTHGNGFKEMKEYIQSVNRPYEDSMPFGVDMTVLQPHDHDHSRIRFEIRKEVNGCAKCKPSMTTEDYTESQPFEIDSCEKSCKKNGKSGPLVALSDLWCDDLNTADWELMATGWKRVFNCGWKGFE
ncbi:hypothetical protein ACET3X_000977 [Alternaria dauci]|uniref:Uncharacterized protein n=1 Tax=Alternaria dauci TaxID=48095 RepID=A0ABR3UWH8_9PLEO